VELAIFVSYQPGRVTVAAIAHVFTISRVAEMLGEDEERLQELSIDMFPEDGCLRIIGTGDASITAFTDFGVECLKDLIRDSKR
jgi:hypothetical protein